MSEKKEISHISLGKAANIVAGRNDAYNRMFGDVLPSAVTAELINEKVNNIIIEFPEKAIKGQTIYVDGLVKFKTRYIADKKLVLQVEYDKIERAHTAEEAVESEEDPIAAMAAKL